MWLLRDFVLELGEDEDTGEPLTAQDYLERCLKEQEGFSQKIAEKNRIRTLIKTFFKVSTKDQLIPIEKVLLYSD